MISQKVFKNKSIQKKIEFIILFLILISGIIIRIININSLFTNYDDIGIASCILSYSDSLGLKRLRFISDFGWTYGPLQMLLPCLYLKKTMTYDMVLFTGRLPSLLCGIATILLHIQYLGNKQTEENKFDFGKVISLTLLAFSWENIIYSCQMEPYEIGLVFVYLILFQMKRKKPDLIMTLVLTLSCYAQYQLFIFTFCIYLVLFIEFSLEKNMKQIYRLLLSAFITLFMCIPLIFRLVNRNLLSRGTNWNAGPNDLFLYKSGNNNQILYTLKFFVKNSFILFKTYFISNKEGTIYWIFAGLLMFLFVKGLIYAHKVKTYKDFAFFTDLVLCIFLILILKGKLAFSPTRHNIILVPIIVIMINLGFKEDISRVQFNICKMVLGTSLLLGIIFIFFGGYEKEYIARENHFSSTYFRKIVEEYNPSYICTYGYKFDINVCNLKGYKNVSDNALAVNNYLFRDYNLGYISKVIFIGGKEIENDVLEDFKSKCSSINGNKQISLSQVSISSIQGDTAVEYATDYFGKTSNGLYFYVYNLQLK